MSLSLPLLLLHQLSQRHVNIEWKETMTMEMAMMEINRNRNVTYVCRGRIRARARARALFSSSSSSFPPLETFPSRASIIGVPLPLLVKPKDIQLASKEADVRKCMGIDTASRPRRGSERRQRPNGRHVAIRVGREARDEDDCAWAFEVEHEPADHEACCDVC